MRPMSWLGDKMCIAEVNGCHMNVKEGCRMTAPKALSQTYVSSRWQPQFRHP